MAGETRHTAHIPEWKVRDVDELVEKISKSRVVGIVGVREIPADNIQQMRGDLRGNVEIRMVRNTIARRALQASAPEIRQLSDYIEDQTALIFSDENPFKLYRLLEKGKKPMPIKAGARAPRDIVIEAGETSFSPGPMVAQTSGCRRSRRHQGRKGGHQPEGHSGQRGRGRRRQDRGYFENHGDLPQKCGPGTASGLRGGSIFKVADLTIDVEAQLSELALASAKAFGLAVEIGYATPSTVGPMLARAQRRASALVLEAGIPVPGMMEMLLAKAAANARALSRLASGEATAAAPAAAAPVAKAAAEEEKEEKKDEEETAAGLGALFG